MTEIPQDPPAGNTPAPAEPAAPPADPPTSSQQSELPLWFRVAAIGMLVITLIAHIMVDVFVKTYEGAATSLMLGGIVGTALGLNEFLRGRQ